MTRIWSREEWATTKTPEWLRDTARLSRLLELRRLREELECAEYFLRNYEKYAEELQRRGISKESIELDVVKMRLELYGLTGISELF